LKREGVTTEDITEAIQAQRGERREKEGGATGDSSKRGWAKPNSRSLYKNRRLHAGGRLAMIAVREGEEIKHNTEEER